MKTLLTAIYNLMAGMHPAVKGMIGVGTLVLAINEYVNELWAEMFARIDTIAGQAAGVADFTALGLVNYVFPLDTVLTFITSYAALRLVCAGIRIIKSFIPTIS